MAKSVLHILSQRPGRTGSGVTLDSIVRCAQYAGWQQHVIVGTPADDPNPQVGELAADQIHPLVFPQPSLPFPLPGMSGRQHFALSPHSQDVSTGQAGNPPSGTQSPVHSSSRQQSPPQVEA